MSCRRYSSFISTISRRPDRLLSLFCQLPDQPGRGAGLLLSLSVATSFFVGDEYIFSNYMDNVCYSIHTPSTSSFYSETMMHKHNFFELIYIQRGSIGMKIEDNDFTYHTGDLCLLNRNTKHVETDIFDADICYLAIDPQFIIRWPQHILRSSAGEIRWSAFFGIIYLRRRLTRKTISFFPFSQRTILRQFWRS